MLLSEAEKKLNKINKNKAPIPSVNKGERGLWIEKQLGIKANSKLNDFEDGELKVFVEGETIAVTSLKHCLPLIFERIDRRVSYAESNVGKKLKNVLFVKFAKTGEFVKSYVFNAKKYSELHYLLSEDYRYICNEIRKRFYDDEKLETITGENKLLQIRTKASKGKNGRYTPLEYDGKILKDKYMAFYLTTEFTKKLAMN